MEDSTTYQYILEQGAIREAKWFLLEIGKAKLGAPTETVEATIKQLEDLSRLERMVDCTLDTATSWDEILDTP
ncbi:MAG: hypothetical protein ACLQGP_40235 [Isosphaeraceae bacterium]